MSDALLLSPVLQSFTSTARYIRQLASSLTITDAFPDPHNHGSGCYICEAQFGRDPVPIKTAQDGCAL